jgi:hypothetical protein
MVVFVCRPSLKSRRVSSNTGKVAVVQPIENVLLLAHTCIPLSVFTVFSGAVSERSLRTVIVALIVVRLFPATPDEQHITDFDVAALSSGSNVNTLVLAALVELLETDGIVVIGVVVDTLLVRVATVVKENTTACNTMLSPVMDGALMVG